MCHVATRGDRDALDGNADLAMLPTRGWHVLGVMSMDAFEAPFLIDNDASWPMRSPQPDRDPTP